MILIISRRDDGAVRRVVTALRRRGARLVGPDGDADVTTGVTTGVATDVSADGAGTPVLWWDTADFPGRSRITASFSGGERRLLLDTGDGTVDLSRVTAVWRSRPGAPSAAGTVTEPSHRAHVDR
ncbi:hypothetical protein [Streptosporangium sp. NPDC048865]|uniref:hypothetical protein n=1 Tax=Streptosporangium sp. NPDC048865 TaxID=3155766 RepID=UPI0034162A28